MTALCLIIAVPVALEHLAADGARTLGPQWLWWAAYGVFLTALVLGSWLERTRAGEPA